MASKRDDVLGAFHNWMKSEKSEVESETANTDAS